MDYLFYIIFFLCLFLYLHISSHYRKGEDLEVFETDYHGNESLQESCKLLQPLLIVGMKGIPYLPSHETLMEGNTSYNGCIRDMDTWRNQSGALSSDLVDSMVPKSLPMHGILEILASDSQGRYLSEGNGEFLEESGYYKKIRKWGEEQLAPKYSLWTRMDVWMGSRNSCTPLRYHTFYRQYLIPRTRESIRVKLTPWKSRKYLHPFRNDSGMEVISPIVPWGVARMDQTEEREKLKFMEVVVPEGRALYIPPFWWYSIEFPRSDTVVYSYTYMSPMNWLANSEVWLRYLWASRSGISGIGLEDVSFSHTSRNEAKNQTIASVMELTTAESGNEENSDESDQEEKDRNDDENGEKRNDDENGEKVWPSFSNSLIQTVPVT